MKTRGDIEELEGFVKVHYESLPHAKELCEAIRAYCENADKLDEEDKLLLRGALKIAASFTVTTTIDDSIPGIRSVIRKARN